MVHLLTFTEIYKERIWGGRNLERLFNKKLPPQVPIGESWELVDLPDDKSVVNIGPAAGKTIAQLVREWSSGLLGSARLDDGQFPLLVKFLDANDSLSVQVHPDYESAAEMGGDVRAKYEAWYVVDAEDGAYTYVGLKPGVTREDLRRALVDGNLAQCLARLPARTGDYFYLPGGTVHALGSGLIVAEIQTPADTTFRLYDWNRIDSKTGRPRDLQVEQALRCVRPDQPPPTPKTSGRKSIAGTGDLPLICAPTFCMYRRIGPSGESVHLSPDQPAVWVVIRGSGRLTDQTVSLDLIPGKVVLIPPGIRRATADFSSQTTYLEVKLTS